MSGFKMDDYVDVPARLRAFREKHPEGSLQPADLAKPYDIITVADKTFVVYVACAYRAPDDQRPGVGAAWEPFPGKTPYTRESELMNAETSAWGRAILAALAADAKRIASDEEIATKTQASGAEKEGPGVRPPAPGPSEPDGMVMSPMALRDAQVRAAALVDAKVSVFESRRSRGLPKLDARLSQSQWEAWLEILDELEASTAPFAESKS